MVARWGNASAVWMLFYRSWPKRHLISTIEADLSTLDTLIAEGGRSPF
jgi:hypothetical protein